MEAGKLWTDSPTAKEGRTYAAVSGDWNTGTFQTVCFPCCLFVFVHAAPRRSPSQDEIDADVCEYVWILNSLSPPSVYVELTGASRVASGPPSACASRPFEALKQARLGMINRPAEWHAPQLSFRPAASSPAALPPDTASSVTAPFVHTTRFPQCHLPDLPPVPPPPLPPKSIKELCSGGISSFGWYHPPCCAVNTGSFYRKTKATTDNWINYPWIKSWSLLEWHLQQLCRGVPPRWGEYEKGWSCMCVMF